MVQFNQRKVGGGEWVGKQVNKTPQIESVGKMVEITSEITLITINEEKDKRLSN